MSRTKNIRYRKISVESNILWDIETGSDPEIGGRLSMYRVRHNSVRSHYCDVIMGAMMSQITSFTIVYSTVNWGADQRKHQSSSSVAFVWGIHRWPVNSSHKGPVTRKRFPIDDVIMKLHLSPSKFIWLLIIFWRFGTSGVDALDPILFLKRVDIYTT